MIAMGFPHIYRQGDGLIDELGRHAGIFGSRPLVVADGLVRVAYESRISKSLTSAGLKAVPCAFDREITPQVIEAIVTTARDNNCDLAIGIGGGKVLDAAKAVKRDLKCPVVMVPTIASNDAPTSRLIITYEENGGFLGPLIMPINPDMVLVDTRIIAEAPVRFLIAGIGDALSTYFEAEQCRASGAVNFFDGQASETALVISRHCYDLVRQYGEEAVRSVERREVCPALEKIIEANVLLSGLGFESCGVAGAHAISQSFTLIPEMRGALHGEEVAMGLLVQLALEARSDGFILDLVDFYQSIRLPVSLNELGMREIREADLDKIAAFACRPKSRIYNMAVDISPANVKTALMRIENLVKSHRANDS